MTSTSPSGSARSRATPGVGRAAPGTRRDAPGENRPSDIVEPLAISNE